MAWTNAQRKAHAARMKAYWKNRRAEETQPKKEAKVSPPKSDPVNKPAHYTHARYEVIDVLESFFDSDPLLWQVGKYLMRAGHKDDMVQDLEKAAWYLQRKINRLKGA